MAILFLSAIAFAENCSSQNVVKLKFKFYENECLPMYYIHFIEHRRLKREPYFKKMKVEYERRKQVVYKKYGDDLHYDDVISIMSSEFTEIEDEIGEIPIFVPYHDHNRKKKLIVLENIDKNGNGINPDHFCENHFPRHFIGKKISLLAERREYSSLEDERIYLYNSTKDEKYLIGMTEELFYGVSEDDYSKVMKNELTKYINRSSI